LRACRRSFVPPRSTVTLGLASALTLRLNLSFTTTTEQNQQVLASALQTAFNLGMLPGLVKTLLGDLTEAVEGRIRRTFDLASLARDAGLKGAHRFRLLHETSSDPLPSFFLRPSTIDKQLVQEPKCATVSERTAAVGECALGQDRRLDRRYGLMLREGASHVALRPICQTD